MTRRFWIACSLLPLLAACQSVPDRYAFWQSNPASAADSDKKTNLGDIPAAPNVADSKAQMEAMRQRLESDRLNALRSAQGLAPMPEAAPQTATVAPAPANGVGMDELAPATPSAQAQYAAVDPAVAGGYNYGGYTAPVAAPAPNAWQQGHVQYNYAPDGQSYTYGLSAIQRQQYSQISAQANQLMAANPSVSIDLGALDEGTGPKWSGPEALARSGQAVAFFDHGSAQLKAKDRKAIRTLAEQLKQEPVSVVVVGHASKRTGINDPATSRAANLQMSAKRATSVLRELAKQGVDAKRVSVIAEGDHGARKKHEAEDRRVDLLFDK